MTCQLCERQTISNDIFDLMRERVRVSAFIGFYESGSYKNIYPGVHCGVNELQEKKDRLLKIDHMIDRLKNLRENKKEDIIMRMSEKYNIDGE